jgi:hypothetical protein
MEIIKYHHKFHDMDNKFTLMEILDDMKMFYYKFNQNYLSPFKKLLLVINSNIE